MTVPDYFGLHIRQMEGQMDRADALALKQEARLLLGIPADVISSEADIALQCAIDMGYRRPESVAHMAKRLMTPPDKPVVLLP